MNPAWLIEFLATENYPTVFGPNTANMCFHSTKFAIAGVINAWEIIK